jgi:hypothetical protein
MESFVQVYVKLDLPTVMETTERKASADGLCEAK